MATALSGEFQTHSGFFSEWVCFGINFHIENFISVMICHSFYDMMI